jgi:predicted alpha/beta hydrolase family esterase
VSSTTRNADTPVLMLPGFGGSGPDHWQSEWERQHPEYTRVEQRDWDNPNLIEWLDTLERTVETCSAPPVLVAHSLACSLVAHFVSSRDAAVGAALLVSPADVDEICGFYSELESFAPMPLHALPFPSITVVGSNDMYVLPERAKLFADAWGSRLVVLEGVGHINPDSGAGEWTAGQAYLAELIALG